MFETQYSVGKRVLGHQGGTWYNVRYEGDTDLHTYLWSSSDGVNWGNKVRIDDAAMGSAQRGALLTWLDNGNPRIGVYWMLRGITPQEARFSLSTDQGASFGASTTVSADAPNAEMNGAIARGDDGTLWAAWTRRLNGSHDGLYFSTSADDGASWTPTALAADTGSFGWSHAVAAGAANQAWIAVSHTNASAIVYRTADGGTSWQEAIAGPGTSSTTTAHPVLERASNGDLLLVFEQRSGLDQQYDVYFTRSGDAGVSWSTPVQVSDDVTTGTSASVNYYPALAEGGSGRLYVVWTDDRAAPSATQGAGNHDVYLSYSVDSGATWSTDTRVNDFPEEFDQSQAAVAVAPGTTQDTVVVSWADARSGVYQVRSLAQTLP